MIYHPRIQRNSGKTNCLPSSLTEEWTGLKQFAIIIKIIQIKYTVSPKKGTYCGEPYMYCSEALNGLLTKD